MISFSILSSLSIIVFKTNLNVFTKLSSIPSSFDLLNAYLTHCSVSKTSLFNSNLKSSNHSISFLGGGVSFSITSL